MSAIFEELFDDGVDGLRGSVGGEAGDNHCFLIDIIECFDFNKFLSSLP